MNRLFRTALVAGAWLLILGVAACGQETEADDSPGENPAAEEKTEPEPEPQKTNRKISVTISPETTVIVEPLTEFGRPDYYAAINAFQSEGVTVENNAAVVFAQLIDLTENDESWRENYFERLGIPVPDEDADHFENFSQYLKRTQPANDSREAEQAAFDQLDAAMRRPWSSEEFPLVAKWLTAHNVHLDRLAEATKRPHFYSPLATFDADEPEMLIAALLPLDQELRSVARAWVSRAMLRVEKGQIDAAIADLLACHRLARLEARGPTLIQGLVGYAIDGVAYEAALGLIHSGKVNEQQAKDYLTGLNRLPAFPKMVEKVDRCERYMFLDSVIAISMGGPKVLSELDGLSDEGDGFGARFQKGLMNASVNWDETLKVGNAWYDRAVAAMKLPTRPERRKALDALLEEMKTTQKEVTSPSKLLGRFLQFQSPRKTIGRQMGQILVSLLAPAMIQVALAEDRTLARFDMLQIALSLEAYRGANGVYPKSLAELKPTYFDEVPIDIFSTEPLHYTGADKSYRLYSVGPNEADDGGVKNDNDINDGDMVIEVPQPMALDENKN